MMASVNDAPIVRLEPGSILTPVKTPSRMFGRDLSNGVAFNHHGTEHSAKKIVRIQKSSTVKKQIRKPLNEEPPIKDAATRISSLIKMDDGSSSIHSTRSEEIESGTETSDLEYKVRFEQGPIGLKLEPVVESMGRQVGCRVMQFMDGGPKRPGQARKSGKIRPGDLLVSIDTVDVMSWNYPEIIERLKLPSTGRLLSFRTVWGPIENVVLPIATVSEKTPSTSIKRKSSNKNARSSQVLSSVENVPISEPANKRAEEASNMDESSETDLSTVDLSETKATALSPSQLKGLSDDIRYGNDRVPKESSSMLGMVVRKVALPAAGIVASSSYSLTATVTSAMSNKLGEVLVGHSSREFSDTVQLKTKLLTELSQAKAALDSSLSEQQRLRKVLKKVSEEKDSERNAKEAFECDLLAATKEQEVFEDRIKDTETHISALSQNLDNERQLTKVTREDFLSQVNKLNLQKEQLRSVHQKENATLAEDMAASLREKEAIHEITKSLKSKVHAMTGQLQEKDLKFDGIEKDLKACIENLKDGLKQKDVELDSTKDFVQKLLSQQEKLTKDAEQFDSILREVGHEESVAETGLILVQTELDKAHSKVSEVETQIKEMQSSKINLEQDILRLKSQCDHSDAQVAASTGVFQSMVQKKDDRIATLEEKLYIRETAVKELRSVMQEKNTVLETAMLAVETTKAGKEKLLSKIEELESIANEAISEKACKDNDIAKLQTELPASLRRVSFLEQQLSRMEGELASSINMLQTEIAAKSETIQLTTAELIEKGATVDYLHKVVREKDEALVIANKKFNDLDSTMGEINNAIADRDAFAQKTNEEIKLVKAHYLQDSHKQQARAAKKDANIQSLENKLQLAHEQFIGLKDATKKMEKGGEYDGAHVSQDLRTQKLRAAENDALIQSLENQVQLAHAQVNELKDANKELKEVICANVRCRKDEKKKATDFFDENATARLLREKDGSISRLEKTLANASFSDLKLHKKVKDLKNLHANDIAKLERRLKEAVMEKDDTHKMHDELQQSLLRDAESTPERNQFDNISRALREAEDIVSRLHGDFNEDREEADKMQISPMKEIRTEMGRIREGVPRIGSQMKCTYLQKELVEVENRAKEARAEAVQRFRRVKSLEADLEAISREVELLVKTNGLMEERLRATRSAQLNAETDVEALSSQLAVEKKTSIKLQKELKHEVAEKQDLSQQVRGLEKGVDNMMGIVKDRESKFESAIQALYKSRGGVEAKLAKASTEISDQLNEISSLKIKLEEVVSQRSELEQEVNELRRDMEGNQSNRKCSEEEFQAELSVIQKQLVTAEERENALEKIINVHEQKMKTFEIDLENKKKETNLLNNEIENQRARCMTVEASREEAVSKLVEASSLVANQKESMQRFVEYELNSKKEIEELNQQIECLQETMATLEIVSSEQEAKTCAEVEKARSVFQKEAKEASTYTVDLEKKIAQAHKEAVDIEATNISLRIRVDELSVACEDAKKREAENNYSHSVRSNQTMKLENELDEKKNESDRLVAHCQVLGSTITRLRSEVLLQETGLACNSQKSGCQNGDGKQIAEEELRSEELPEQNTEQSMKAAGAKMICRLVEKRSKSTVSNAFRQWACAASAAHAVSYQLQVAEAMAQQLETTREKLVILKSHLKHASSERKNHERGTTRPYVESQSK